MSEKFEEIERLINDINGINIKLSKLNDIMVDITLGNSECNEKDIEEMIDCFLEWKKELNEELKEKIEYGKKRN